MVFDSFQLPLQHLIFLMFLSGEEIGKRVHTKHTQIMIGKIRFVFVLNRIEWVNALQSDKYTKNAPANKAFYAYCEQKSINPNGKIVLVFCQYRQYSFNKCYANIEVMTVIKTSQPRSKRTVRMAGVK